MVVRIHIKAPTFAPMAQAPAIPPFMAECAALFRTSDKLRGVFGSTLLLLFVLVISLMALPVMRNTTSFAVVLPNNAHTPMYLYWYYVLLLEREGAFGLSDLLVTVRQCYSSRS
jgi:hypothetical protein